MRQIKVALLALRVMALTGGQGVDTAIEAVGIPATFKVCVVAAGTIANVGVHWCKVDLDMERLWSHNVTIKTGLVDQRAEGDHPALK